MPKKRRPQYTYASNNAQASTSPRHPSASQPTRSVNERLAQLRRETAPPPTIEAINRLQDVASSHTQPPAIRGILGIPETTPLGARPRRRPPGVAAPIMSYVYSTSGFETPGNNGSRSKIAEQPDHLRRRPRDFGNFAQMVSNSEQLPKLNSLLHFVLKSMAKDWLEFMEYEQHNIHQLPISLRSALLIYISLFGPSAGINKSTFKLLLSQADASSITRLDFNGLLSSDFDFVHLYRYLTKAPRKSDNTMNPTKPLLRHDSGTVITVDTLSWEEQLDSGMSSLTLSVSPKPFENLTHLGLGNPGKYASWSQLLTLAPHVSRLTHLSLAYWPSPSLDGSVSARVTLPSLEKFRSMVIQDVQGTIRQAVEQHFTRRLEDFKEAAHVLKILSHHLYRLEYIDLEGCYDWIPALAWKELGRVRPIDHPNQAQNTEWAIDHDQMSYCPPFEPALTEAWGCVNRIHVKQGWWTPTDVDCIMRTPDGFVRKELLNQLGVLSYSINTTKNIPVTASFIETLKWVEIEKQIRLSVARISILRHDARKSWIHFDHGLHTRDNDESIDGETDQIRGVMLPPGFHDDLRTRRYNLHAY